MIASFFVYPQNSNLLISFHRGNWNPENFFTESKLKAFLSCMVFAVGKSGE